MHRRTEKVTCRGGLMCPYPLLCLGSCPADSGRSMCACGTTKLSTLSAVDVCAFYIDYLSLIKQIYIFVPTSPAALLWTNLCFLK